MNRPAILAALTLAAALIAAPFTPAQAAQHAPRVAQATQTQPDPELQALQATHKALRAQVKAQRDEGRKAKLRAQIADLRAKLEATDKE